MNTIFAEYRNDIEKAMIFSLVVEELEKENVNFITEYYDLYLLVPIAGKFIDDHNQGTKDIPDELCAFSEWLKSALKAVNNAGKEAVEEYLRLGNTIDDNKAIDIRLGEMEKYMKLKDSDEIIKWIYDHEFC